MSSSAAVSVQNVSMVYSGKAAVDDASFNLHAGRFLTILGPSGSGKTTLLRMIAGFARPSSGAISINGSAVDAIPPHQRSIGMVFQRLALFPHLTAAENVAFPLKMRRFDAREIPARVERYLDLVRLGGYGKRRINELSGGQQQRVAIARALVFKPDLLLLDEPLAALDRKLREEMQLEFRRIQKELGVTTINVTHDQREALVVSDEIIVMDGGRIQQNAAPTSIYRQPANHFVAGFIGVTNFLNGPVMAASGNRISLTIGSTLVEGHSPAGSQAPVHGQQMAAAIRAEHVRLALSPLELADCDIRLEGDLQDVIFEGDRVVCEITVPALDRTLVRVFDANRAHLDQLVPGAKVHLGWQSADVFIFAANQ